MVPFLHDAVLAEITRQRIQLVLMVLNLLNSHIPSRKNYVIAFHE